MKLRHVGVKVTDLFGMVEFYRSLGFRKTAFSFEHDLDICKLSHADGSTVELIKTARDWPQNHFAVNVSEQRFNELIPAASGIFRKENVCYIYDPEGNQIEIVKTA